MTTAPETTKPAAPRQSRQSKRFHAARAEAARDSQFKSSQFSKPTQSSNSRITGICFFVKIIQHLMTMIWAHRNRNISLLHYSQ